MTREHFTFGGKCQLYKDSTDSSVNKHQLYQKVVQAGYSPAIAVKSLTTASRRVILNKVYTIFFHSKCSKYSKAIIIFLNGIM